MPVLSLGLKRPRVPILFFQSPFSLPVPCLQKFKPGLTCWRMTGHEKQRQTVPAAEQLTPEITGSPDEAKRPPQLTLTQLTNRRTVSLGKWWLFEGRGLEW